MLRNSLLACSLLLTSCATMFQGGPSVLHFDSEPEGASVYVDGMRVGKTPVTVPVRHSASGMVRYELEGYETVHQQLSTSLNGTVFLNLFIYPFTLIGAVVDGVTGNFSSWESPPSVRLDADR